MKDFKEYLQKNIVRTISPDKLRAGDLLESSNKRDEFLGTINKNVAINENNASFFIEQVYDVLIELIRAKMFIDGFAASGNYAHEAEVSYLKVLGFNDFEISTMDRIRQFRNSTKYYGKKYTREEAINALNFIKEFLPKLKKLLKKT